MMIKIFNQIGNVMYSFAALSLFCISIAMIVYGLWEIGYAIATKGPIIDRMLDAIGLIVISIAVFDVSKHLIEEEVLRDRELRSPSSSSSSPSP